MVPRISTTCRIEEPGEVGMIGSVLREPHEDEVVVQTLHTAISAGTEMLVFRGEMPDGIPLDSVNLAYSAPFSYPAAYGYCYVGKITWVGNLVTRWRVGDIAFAFRNHANLLILKESDLMHIPEGIAPEDAVLMPFIETAVCICMDAAVLPGENVLIVGQGFIGLLIVDCLRRLHPLSKIVTVEPDDNRRKLSKTIADAHAAFNPNNVSFGTDVRAQLDNGKGADVSIEVSGSGHGLDTAIQLTRDDGRVVVGSWYGSKSVSISCLGSRFHRSHMTLVASQVSEIPRALSGRWNKNRRFELVWKLLKMIQPTWRYPISRKKFADAEYVFPEVDQKKHLQVIFDYPLEREGYKTENFVQGSNEVLELIENDAESDAEDPFSRRTRSSFSGSRRSLGRYSSRRVKR